MSVAATVIRMLFVAPAHPAVAPCAIVTVIVPWSVPRLSYFLALYTLPVTVSVVSSHIFIARFVVPVFTTVFSQFVTLYWNPKVWPVQLSVAVAFA